MLFEDALDGMRKGKNATFGRCTGHFFVRCVTRKDGTDQLRLYYQTPEGIVGRQYKLGVNWVLSCDWRFIEEGDI